MITLTENAIVAVKDIISKQGNKDLKLRLGIAGGGCSGYQYKLNLEKEESKKSDKVFNFDGVTVVVDAKSLLFLGGVTLDYVSDPFGPGFSFINPDAKTTCGCGSSFSTN